MPAGVAAPSNPESESFEIPWEMYWSMSSRETPCDRSRVTANESGSWKSAASRSPASTSSFSALSQCETACWSTRWKASVCCAS